MPLRASGETAADSFDEVPVVSSEPATAPLDTRPEQRPNQTAEFADRFTAIASNIASVVRGKDEVVELAVTCLLAGGHLLVDDVPGVGKTSLAKALARSVSGHFSRIQFTPDLLPADLLGSSVWHIRDARFEFHPGPIFTDILLADEINRASPKTQSALLEAMAEEQVTVDGVTHRLGTPFMVVATQNPIEHRGTHPLPEAQLDRFLLRVALGYPDRAHELEILLGNGGEPVLDALHPVVTAAEVVAMTRFASNVHVDERLAGYLVDLATASRRHGSLLLGISPRAALGLQKAARVRAASAGRTYVTPDDIKALAAPAWAHRIILNSDAQLRGLDGVAIVHELLETVAVPAPIGS